MYDNPMPESTRQQEGIETNQPENPLIFVTIFYVSSTSYVTASDEKSTGKL